MGRVAQVERKPEVAASHEEPQAVEDRKGQSLVERERASRRYELGDLGKTLLLGRGQGARRVNGRVLAGVQALGQPFLDPRLLITRLVRVGIWSVVILVACGGVGGGGGDLDSLARTLLGLLDGVVVVVGVDVLAIAPHRVRDGIVVDLGELVRVAKSPHLARHTRQAFLERLTSALAKTREPGGKRLGTVARLTRRHATGRRTLLLLLLAGPTDGGRARQPTLRRVRGDGGDAQAAGRHDIAVGSTPAVGGGAAQLGYVVCGGVCLCPAGASGGRGFGEDL